MGMEPALTRHMPTLLEIETSSAMMFDEDFDTMVVSPYLWSESDFYELTPNGYGLYGYFSNNGKLLGFVVLRHDVETKTIRITKIEVLRDGEETGYFNYIVNWIISESDGTTIVFLTNEADDLKNYCLKELGFNSEIRKQAFRKIGRDGIWWTFKTN